MSAKRRKQQSPQSITPAQPENPIRPASEQTSQGGPGGFARPSSGGAVLAHREELSISHHSGPLPDPATFGQYELVLPGVAERIMRMAEDEAKHRRAMERKGENRANGGVAAAFLIAMGGFAVSAYGFWLGYPVEAATITTGAIAAITGAFIYGTNVKSKKEPDDE